MSDNSGYTVVKPDFPFAIIPEALISDASVMPTAFRLYARLARLCPPTGAASFAGVEYLASEMGWSERSVSRNLDNLIQSGWVHRKRRLGRSTLTYLCPSKGHEPPWASTPDRSGMTGGEHEDADQIGISNLPEVAGLPRHLVAGQKENQGERELEERNPVTPPSVLARAADENGGEEIPEKVRGPMYAENCTIETATGFWPRGDAEIHHVNAGQWAKALRDIKGASMMSIAYNRFLIAWEDADEYTRSKYCPKIETWLTNRKYLDKKPQGPRDDGHASIAESSSVLARESVGPPHPGDVPDFDDITGEYLPDLELARVKWDARVKWEAFHGKQAYSTPLPPRP